MQKKTITGRTARPTGTRLSRRAFLRSCALGGAGLLAPGAARAAQKAAQGGEELATVLDLSRCVGCGACVYACRDANGHKYPEPEKPFPAMYPPRVKVEDFSDKRDVDDRLTPYNWLYIQTAAGEHEGEPFEINIPRRCMHCQNPPCANLCPWGAAGREPNGIVRINPDVCLGGAKCRTVCPWDIPQRQTGVGLYLDLLPSFAGNGVMYKCDRCFERVAEGELPACIEACPERIQTIGPRAEMLELAEDLAADMGGYVYGAEENGGTNTFYVSPVPFEVLDAAVEHGKGRPGLQPVEDLMAQDGNLAKAALIAPFAGVAAGLLGLGGKLFAAERAAKEGDDAD